MGFYDYEFRATPPSPEERRGVRRLTVTHKDHVVHYDSDDVTVVWNPNGLVERCVYCKTCRHDIVLSTEERAKTAKK